MGGRSQKNQKEYTTWCGGLANHAPRIPLFPKHHPPLDNNDVFSLIFSLGEEFVLATTVGTAAMCTQDHVRVTKDFEMLKAEQ